MLKGTTTISDNQNKQTSHFSTSQGGHTEKGGPHFQTPDQFNIVSEETCKRFNSELMRVMINKKMKKNVSFTEFMTGKSPKTNHDLLGFPV